MQTMMVWTAPPKRHQVQSVTAGASQRETVHEEVYQNRARSGQELFSDPRARERERGADDAQDFAGEAARVLCGGGAVPDRHGGLRFGALLGARIGGARP